MKIEKITKLEKSFAEQVHNVYNPVQDNRDHHNQN